MLLREYGLEWKPDRKVLQGYPYSKLGVLNFGLFLALCTRVQVFPGLERDSLAWIS